jgi:hypothetical protein
MDMAVLWSQLVATPGLKELPARQVVEDERAARDTLANMAFVLWLFALEALVFFYTYRHDPRHALLALLPIPAGYIVYRFAVAKAEAWGDAVETLHDLHRDKLHEALKLPKFSSWSEERAVWQRASAFIVGDPQVGGDETFQRDEAPSVTAVPAGELTVPEPVTAFVDEPAAGSTTLWTRSVEYVVLVARAPDAGDAATTAQLLVDDPRVARIDSSPALVGGGPATATVVRGAHGSQVLWSLAGPPPGGATWLRYRLPLYTIALSPSAELHPVPGVGIRVDGPMQTVSVTSFASSGDSSRPQLRDHDTPLVPAIAGDVYTWSGLGPGPHWLLIPEPR